MTSSSACSKECSHRELLSLLPSVLENLHEGKIKKLSDEQFKALYHFFKRARHVCVLADWARKNSDLRDSCACCSKGKGENSAIERICCGCFTVKRAHM